MRKVKLLLQGTGCYQPFMLDHRLPLSNANCASSAQQDVTSTQNTKNAMNTKHNEHELITTDCSYNRNDIGSSQYYRSSSFASNISSPKQLMEEPYTSIQINEDIDASSHSSMQSVPHGGGSDFGVQKMKRSDTSDTYATSIGSSNSGTRVKLMKKDDINVYAGDKCNKFCLSQFYFYFVSIFFFVLFAFFMLTCYILGNQILHNGLGGSKFV